MWVFHLFLLAGGIIEAAAPVAVAAELCSAAFPDDSRDRCASKTSLSPGAAAAAAADRPG